MFSKVDMQEGTKYDFLRQKLSQDFSIPDNNRSKVIFGYNGVGKTSIFRYIRDEQEDSRITFLDYIDGRNDFIKKKKKIQVSVDVIRINELDNEIATIKNEMNIKSNLASNFNITNATIASTYGDKIKDAQKDIFDGFDSTREVIANICNSLGDIPPSFLLENNQVLSETIELENEISAYKDSVLFRSLALLNTIVDDNDTNCPICDSTYPDIKNKILERMTELDERRSQLIENLREKNLQPTEDNISKMIKTKTLLSTDVLKNDWMICNGNIENYDNIKEKHHLLNTKVIERSQLMTDSERLYANLKVNEYKIKNDISKYFSINIDDIKFSDSAKTLTIKLPRDVDSYSTGEMNLLSFLIRIYEFIGSDKSILILDDPVSSLDIINHYKIVYEIVKAASNGKTLIILTHSIEMLNAINSQYSVDFDYYYIEETNELLIQEIPRRDDGKNILTLDILLEVDELDIIAALIKKENSPFTDDIHKIFHYDESFTHTDYPSIGNDYFVNMIENYNHINNISFVQNSYSKVIIIAALRVWVEYKIRLLIEGNEVLLTDFISKPTLVSKISVLLKRDGTVTAEIPENLTREGLMSKKVMLNQGIHYQSQIMPFAYALNISLHDLNQEIIDIKKLFE